MGLLLTILIPALLIIAVFSIRAALPPKSRSDVAKKPASPPQAAPKKAVAASPTQTPPVAVDRSGSKELLWLGTGSVLEFAGVRIVDPLTYTSSGRAAQDPSEIVRSLEVARDGRSDAQPMPYWPWYAKVHPKNRREYLAWLSSGKKTIPSQDGYLFLYFYGLERRAIVDRADHNLIFWEVLRLRALDAERAASGAGRSFRRYSAGLLWHILAAAPKSVSEQNARAFMESLASWTEETLSEALAWCAATDRPLPVWLAFRVAAALPESQRSIVTKSSAQEFRALFDRRYAEQHGAGLPLKVAARPTINRYRPASNALRECEIRIPHPFGIRSQFKTLSALWNSCVEDLRRFSRIDRADGPGMSPAAWEAMPAELRKGSDHPLTSQFCSTVGALPVEHGESQGTVGPFASLLGVDLRPRLSITQSRQLAQTAEHIGYGMEPDARLTNRAYGWNDPIVVFLLTDGSPVDPGRYNAASCMFRLGHAVAAADGEVDNRELRALEQELEDMFDLNEADQRRLEALKALLLSKGEDISGIATKVKSLLTPAQRTVLAKALVSIAAADGTIDTTELKALRRVGRALDVNPGVLEGLLAELAGGQDDLVTVALPSGRRSDEPLPPQVAPIVRPQFDREAIQRIMEETREVAKILAEALGPGEESKDGALESHKSAKAASTVAVAPQPATPLAADGPPAKYAALWETLRLAGRLPLGEAQKIARAEGIMLAGAIEGINDWATEALGGAVLYEEGDEIVVETSLLNGV